MVMALGSLSGGCSYKLGNMFGGDNKNVAAIDDDLTGSITPIRVHDDTNLSESDLALARNAASDILTRGAKDASQPWENPGTGARGTVTPIADAYTQDGFTCRDFLASYIRDGAESWLQGDACRIHHGKWTVRKMRPLKRS